MIRKSFLGIAALLFLISTVSPSPADRFGVGLMFFDPSGLSAKAWLSGSKAVAGGIGWSAEKNNYLHLHADFLFTTIRLASDRNLALDFYLGAGGKIIFRDFDSAWFRVPLGIDFRLNRSPLNIFFEVVPSFNFSKLKLLGAVGLRYVFSD